MTERDSAIGPQHEVGPHRVSLATLAKTTVAALVVAALLLVAVVLPAEYAIDPLGSGRWLGLTDIASPPVTPVEMVPAEGAPFAPTVSGPVSAYPLPFKLDVYEVVLQPYEYVEYKYQLEQGATMSYSWKASAPLLQDFHGERPGGPGGAPVEESYDKRDRASADGSFVAPFAGIHGWYWENPGSDPITVRLTTSGFYSGAMEIRSDRTRTPRTLMNLETLTSTGAGTTSETRP